MKTKFTLSLLCVGTAATLGVAPLTHADNKATTHTEVSSEVNPDGSYKVSRHIETTDKAGTSIKTEATEDATVDAEGNAHSRYDSTTTRDPKGLGNKSWSKTVTKSEVRRDGTFDKTTEVKQVTGAGTAQKTDIVSKRRIDAKGNVKTEINERIKTDPQGLMNKTVEDTTKVTETKPTGETSTRTIKKIDGETVSSEVR